MLAVGLLTGFMLGMAFTVLFIFGLMRWTNWLRDKYTVPPLDTSALAEGLIFPARDAHELSFTKEEINSMSKVFNKRDKDEV